MVVPWGSCDPALPGWVAPRLAGSNSGA
jgi:hypothetical protein